jgi:hypothetical protein
LIFLVWLFSKLSLSPQATGPRLGLYFFSVTLDLLNPFLCSLPGRKASSWAWALGDQVATFRRHVWDEVSSCHAPKRKDLRSSNYSRVLWGHPVTWVEQARLGCRRKGSHGSHPSDEYVGRVLELVWIASVKVYDWRRSGCSIAGKTLQMQINSK